MKLYLISQTENGHYDTFDSAVVCADDEETARNIHPRTGEPVTSEQWADLYSCWCSSPLEVAVKYLGEAAEGVEAGIVCASFNAG